MLNSETVYFNNVPVQIRYLPSGDVAVWHPINKQTADFIDQICRGCGRWDGRYNNWIVFSQFKTAIINKIKEICINH